MIGKQSTDGGSIARHPILAEPRDCCLLVVDVQEKFMQVIPDLDKIIKKIVALVKGFQIFQLPVIVTEQYPRGL